MDTPKILDHHPSVIHANDMQTVCAPLKQVGITYFGHARINEQGELTTNCSHPEFFTHYYQQGFYKYDLHLADQIANARYFLWDLVERYGATETLYQTGIEFGLGHTFTIIEKVGSVKNYYHFATKPGQDYMNEFYLQHIDLLEKFVAYFKESLLVNATLNQAYKMICKVSVKEGGYLTKKSYGQFIRQQDIKQFLQKISGDKQELTVTDIRCAYYLLQGKHTANIAKIMKISLVEVTNCINCLKHHYNVYSDDQLIGAILSSNVLVSSKLFSFAELNRVTAILLKRFNDNVES